MSEIGRKAALAESRSTGGPVSVGPRSFVSRLARLGWLGCSGLLSLSMGCGESSGGTLELPPPLPPPVPEDIFEDTGATSVDFRSGTEITVFAGTSTQLRLQVTPPGKHTVRFALLGEARDAFLRDDMVQTDAEGLADTWLTVVAASSNFGVRAAAGSVDKVLGVVTLPSRGGSLILEPDYPGARTIDTWVASFHMNKTCAELEGIPFPDGPTTSSAPFGDGSVRLDRVPANSPLAAVIRAEHFAGGCQELKSLRANADTVIKIEVTDRPLQIADLRVALAFGVEASETLNPALAELAFRAVSPMTGGAADDLAALLDAMSALATDPAAFEQARTSQNWRALLVNELAPDLPGSGLRSMVQNWMRTGLEGLEQPDAIRGTLASPDGEGTATLSLDSVIELSPQVTGFEVQNTASVTAESDDRVRLGASLSWQPTPLLAAAASRAALAEDPVRNSVADAMAREFGCATIATSLADAGNVDGEAFADCDGVCMLQLCQGAMSQLWARVAGSNLPSVAWQISGSSKAEIDAEARPSHVGGTWVGSLTLGAPPETTTIQGPFSGQAQP